MRLKTFVLDVLLEKDTHLMLNVDAQNVKDLTKTAGILADLVHLTPMVYLLTASPVQKTAINKS